MFTGIVETTGQIQQVLTMGTNRSFWISSPISNELKVDQSISHSGVCLTIEELKNSMHRVTAIDETLKKTTLANWKTGDVVNLERSLAMNGRLDGHIVQGHADSTAVCTKRENQNGSWVFEFSMPARFGHLIIEKGSICLDGISLTLFNVKKKKFSVAVIPYTFEHTNMNQLRPDMKVNLEFDLIGKYVSRFREIFE